MTSRRSILGAGAQRKHVSVPEMNNLGPRPTLPPSEGGILIVVHTFQIAINFEGPNFNFEGPN